MTDIEKKMSLSLSDLKRVQRRIKKMEEISHYRMSWLERASDNCWEYPNADSRYIEFEDEMIKLEMKQNILAESSELITKIIDNLSKIQ